MQCADAVGIPVRRFDCEYFQTVTSIQEQTLTFVPKVLAIFLSLIVMGHWVMNSMVEFMTGLWTDFNLYLG